MARSMLACIGAASVFGLMTNALVLRAHYSPPRGESNGLTVRTAENPVSPIATISGEELRGRLSAKVEEDSENGYGRNTVISFLLSSIMLNAAVSIAPDTPSRYAPQTKILQREQKVVEALRERDAQSDVVRGISLSLLPTKFPAGNPSSLSLSEELTGVTLGAIPALALPGFVVWKVSSTLQRAKNLNRVLKRS